MPQSLQKAVLSSIMNKPKIGQKIYVGTSWYIDREEDDFDGGLCEIVSFKLEKSTYFVIVKERPGTSMNYTLLMEDQAKLKKEYGRRRGRMSNAKR